MSNPVLLEEIACRAGYVVGHAQLNVEATLNSLSLEMVRAMSSALAGWRERADVAAVVITGTGDRAFCAGGDIQALYRAIDANLRAGTTVDDYPFRFFEEEYRLDYALHTFPKPVLTVGHGVVMGGGLGVFSASALRVVTEKSRLAVPEITIGLFPDAGATWSLGAMPRHWAMFLGLTGSHVNAQDALLAGMATHAMDHAARTRIPEVLADLQFSGDYATDLAMLRTWLDADAEGMTSALPASELQNVRERDVPATELAAEVAAVNSLAGTSAWIDRGLKNLANGCPTTAGIVVEQLRRVPELSLADTYRLELTVGTHCARNRDFHEGVRALLIDKDNNPQWQYGDIASLPQAHVLSHFEPPWPQHPLQDLGENQA
ncbi:MAG: enoyl-CoA hydratase/isomerase family protein [Pseudomonadota bacterium]